MIPLEIVSTFDICDVGYDVYNQRVQDCVHKLNGANYYEFMNKLEENNPLTFIRKNTYNIEYIPEMKIYGVIQHVYEECEVEVMTLFVYWTLYGSINIYRNKLHIKSVSKTLRSREKIYHKKSMLDKPGKPLNGND